MKTIRVALALALGLLLFASSATAIPLSDVDASTTIVSLDGTTTFSDFLVVGFASQFVELTPTETGFAIEAITSLVSTNDIDFWEGVAFSVSSSESGRHAVFRVTGDASDPSATFGGRLRVFEFDSIDVPSDVFFTPTVELLQIDETSAATTIEGTTVTQLPGAFDAHVEVFASGAFCSFCDPMIIATGRATRIELAFVPEPGPALLVLLGMSGLGLRRSARSRD